MTKIDALKASYDRADAEAKSACAKMIQAERDGNSLLASQYRREYVKKCKAAGDIFTQIEREQPIQFGGVDPE